MSEPPFDPDATIDERRSASAAAGQLEPPTAPPAIAPPAIAPPAIAPELGDATGSDTIDEWRPRHGAPRPEPAGVDTVDEKRPAQVRPCPQCGTMIDARAVICPTCQKATGKRAVPEGAVAIIAAIVVVLIVLYFVWSWVSGG
ncbi:MAG: hypothetical protein HY906_04010 [Deltaproteobacteria bacterium]|nr:hypothetical protein [Deltaproteobacteria bacterium]